MSEMSTAITQSFVGTQNASTRQAMQSEMVRQQAGADQALADLLQQNAEQTKAALPEGQGQAVDISA